MAGPRAVAAKRQGASTVLRTANAPGAGESKDRMVHIRVSPELHRNLRLIVAALDTSLQDWIAKTLEDAVRQAWPATEEGAAP